MARAGECSKRTQTVGEIGYLVVYVIYMDKSCRREKD
jgi:hypothetical protein